MQNYKRLYFYIEEYNRLVYDIYSKDSIAFLVTYFNINKDESIIEDEKLLDGFYERIGNHSGLRFNKYLLLPVYFSNEINTSFNGSEDGLIKEGEGEITIPSSYGIQPYFGDIVKFEQNFLMPEEHDKYPLYVVTGIEKSANTDVTFFKLRLRPFQSFSIDDIQNQTVHDYVFIDYIKSILSIDDAIFSTLMMRKKEYISDKLKEFFDNNSGLIFL